MSDYIEAFFLLIGSGFILTAGVGILRLPDILCRSHALSKALNLGIALILIALFWVIGTFAAGIKVFLAVLFQLITIPIAGHIFALYAYRGDEKE